jgi:predicted enzyme related to lactoylglutathione lyase
MKTSGITAALPQDLGRAQAVIHVTDVRAAVEVMRGRGVQFEGYDTPETRTENGIARMPGGGEAAWFKDSEGNLVGLVPA